MKVVLVTPFPKDSRRIVGGVAGVSKYLADEFAKLPELRVTVVVPQGAGGGESVLEDGDGFSVHRLARKGFWRFLPGTAYDMLAGRRQVRRYLERLEPDIVHYQGATFLAAGCGRRHVLTIHGIAEMDALWEERPAPARWLKWLLLRLTEADGRRRVPNVILISDYVKSVLPERSSRRVWRIDNPIADSFLDVKRAAEPGRVFCCGRIMPRKNVVGLIAAFRRAAARAPRARLRLAGTAEPDYLDACKREAARRGLRERVRFLGGLSVREVQYELSKASCFALPSFQETAPLSIAEAMAAGVPVVASAVGGVPEMIEHGRTGFLVDPNDPRDIGDAIAKVLADERLARSMACLAKIRVRERHKASEVARRTVAAYREILDGRLPAEAAP